MLWTDAKIERLIELYRSVEFLYNPKLKDHKSRVKGQLAWQTIANEFGITSVYHVMFSRWKLAQILLQLALCAAFRRWIPARVPARVSGKCVMGFREALSRPVNYTVSQKSSHL